MTTEIVKRKKNGNIVVIANDEYAEGVVGEVLCKLKDSGNGLIAKFPSHSSCYQDYYVCLDYAQAHDLMLALNEHFKEE